MTQFKLASAQVSNRLSAALLSGLLAVGMGTSGLAMAPAMAQETMLRTLTVTGQGSAAVQTTLTQISLGVEAQGETAAAVQQEVARRSTAVVELLRSRNVDKLETTGIQLNPQYNYENGQSELVGYMARNQVSFELPTEAIGTLLEDAVAAGANQILNVSFAADEAALNTARQAALREATQDAQQQANTVLSLLNLGAEEVVSIQIDGANPPMPIPLPQRAEFAAADAQFSASPVIGGEQTVEARVTLQIRY